MIQRPRHERLESLAMDHELEIINRTGQIKAMAKVLLSDIKIAVSQFEEYDNSVKR